MVLTVVTLSVLVEEEELAVVALALVLVSVEVEVLETVLTHVETVMVVKEDKVDIEVLVQVLQQHLFQKEMLEMVVQLMQEEWLMVVVDLLK